MGIEPKNLFGKNDACSNWEDTRYSDNIYPLACGPTIWGLLLNKKEDNTCNMSDSKIRDTNKVAKILHEFIT